MIKESFVQNIDGQKPKSWSFNELRDSLVCNESINAWYIKNWKDFVYNPENLEKQEPWAEDETWRKVKYYRNTKYGQYDIWASNYGRIARRIGENKYKILTDYYEEKIDKSLNKDLLENYETRNRVGYLKIVGLGLYVYQMVADAWLVDKYEPGMEIHHITNDGYDNRPENLIILKTNEHDKIPRDGQPDPAYYPGKYDKK